MAMLRSFTTRKSPLAYEQLTADEAPFFEPKLSRTTSLGSSASEKSGVFGSPAKAEAKQADKASKIHPIFGLFDNRKKKKKMTARPEFSRYMEYLKQGGFGGVMDMANKSNLASK